MDSQQQSSGEVFQPETMAQRSDQSSLKDGNYLNKKNAHCTFPTANFTYGSRTINRERL